MNTSIDSSDIVPKISKKPGIPIVWTLPILALCLCGWLLFTSWRDAGIKITVTFTNGNGLVAGKTQVIANGIPVGLVKELTPNIHGNTVKAVIEMRKETRPYLVEDTLFWVVRPQLSAAGVQGLETFISGIYIGIRGGSSDEERNDFTGLDSVPPIGLESPGLHITLTAKTLGSLQNGSGVYFKDIEIGSVQEYKLKDEQVEIAVHIKPEYQSLVHQDSRFYQIGSVSVGGSLTDLKIQIQSLSTILRGGVMLLTPDNPDSTDKGKVAENGQAFPLYANADDAGYTLPVYISLPNGADSVNTGTKVVFQGLDAGRVREVRLSDNSSLNSSPNGPPSGQLEAIIALDPKYNFILKENTRFWLLKPSISPTGVSHLENILIGAQITFQPGDGPSRDHFRLGEAPLISSNRPGLRFTLTSSEAVSLSPGSLVTFKNIPIGEVVATRLAGDRIETEIFIDEGHQQLIHRDSLFWQQSGVDFKADWSGLSVTTGTAKQVLMGGAAVINPPGKKPRLAQAGQNFPLYSNYQAAAAAHPELRPPGQRIQFLSAETDGSITEGTPILYKNIAIGTVESLSLTAGPGNVLINAALDPERQGLIAEDSRCYPQPAVDFSGGLSGLNLKVAPMSALLRGGIACLPAAGKMPPKKPLPLYASREEAENAGNPLIIIHMKEIGGLREGAPLRYRGVDVGVARSISFGEGAKEIVVKARMKPEMAPLLRAGSRFWLAKPEIGLDGLRGADALLGGYLLFLPGDGPLSREFVALDGPPQDQATDAAGLTLVLETKQLGSLAAGSPVYFRQVRVGEVTSTRLAKGFNQVFIIIRVEPSYAALIRRGTQFWNVSGIQVKAGLFSGVKIKSESLTSLMKGGIALATPPGAEAGDRAKDGAHFTLHDEMKKEWQCWLDAEDRNSATPVPGPADPAPAGRPAPPERVKGLDAGQKR
ncbi:MAG: MlaD family protein [Desulfobulbaceae bacterium]|jgi:paraquat-inducible protein B|nr:MlaD family protein [Desulfobulbaceae bacterium]